MCCCSALVLASPEIRFHVDSETHDPIEVQAKQIRETNSMVEEFMLLANISVAEKIYQEFPECAMLRRHPEPPVNNFEPLVKAGRNLVCECVITNYYVTIYDFDIFLFCCWIAIKLKINLELNKILLEWSENTSSRLAQLSNDD